MYVNNPITRENFNECMKELGRRYRQLYGKKVNVEIILIGGGSILAKYMFRNLTYDVDAIIKMAPGIKDAAIAVADKYNLTHNWLNDDFKNTASYTDKLIEISKHYKRYANVLNVRVVESEYLIAMKLYSGREYKNDLSDVVGILNEHQLNGDKIEIIKIKNALEYLYGKEYQIPQTSINLLERAFNSSKLDELYAEIKAYETNINKRLNEFESLYPNVITEKNIDGIINNIKYKFKDSIVEKYCGTSKKNDNIIMYIENAIKSNTHKFITGAKIINEHEAVKEVLGKCKDKYDDESILEATNELIEKLQPTSDIFKMKLYDRFYKKLIEVIEQGDNEKENNKEFLRSEVFTESKKVINKKNINQER